MSPSAWHSQMAELRSSTGLVGLGEEAWMQSKRFGSGQHLRRNRPGGDGSGALYGNGFICETPKTPLVSNPC